MKDQRLHYVHNFVGTTLTTVSGSITLRYGDEIVGTGHLAQTVPITFGVAGFSVGHQRGRSVTLDYEAPAAFTRGRLGAVTIETTGLAYRDPAVEHEAQIAMQ